MTAGRLSDTDSAERAQLLRVVVYFGPACFVILTGLWVFLAVRETIPRWLAGVLIVLNLPLTGVGVWLIHRATSQASRGFVQALFSAGNIPPPLSYPRQDVMIMRGQFVEAAEYFRDHLTVAPDDNEARLRLADLLERHLGDLAGAERLYLEVRRTQPTARQETAAHNGLIDVYRKAGRRDRLKVELARFAERYRGSPAAEAAARELGALKKEDAGAGG